MSKAVGPEEEGLNSPARTSCMFYKLIVASILLDKKLRIPGKFVKKYGDELSCIATLTVPNGHIWLVELEKVNKKLWFGKGWHEFVEHYSIRIGHFLIFRYDGESNFKVCIFDLTVSEIRYPCNVPGNLQEPSISSRTKLFNKYVHSNWVISGNFDTSRENMLPIKDEYNLGETIRSSGDLGVQLNGSEFVSTTVKVSSSVLGEVQGRTRSGKWKADNPNGNGQVDRRSPSMKIASKALTKRWRAVTAEERQRTIHASYMFKPDYPFFRVILRPSYVYKGFLLHIPSMFARRYLTVTRFMTLQVSEGKQWPVRCVCVKGGAKLSKGWTEFAWENNLEEGDVCIFELINNNALKVTIFRVLEVLAPVNQLPSKIMPKLNE